MFGLFLYICIQKGSIDYYDMISSFYNNQVIQMPTE